MAPPLCEICKKTTELQCFTHEEDICSSQLCIQTRHRTCDIGKDKDFNVDYDWPPVCAFCKNQISEKEMGELDFFARLFCCYCIVHKECLSIATESDEDKVNCPKCKMVVPDSEDDFLICDKRISIKACSENRINIDAEINLTAFKEIFDYFVQNIVNNNPEKSESSERKAVETAAEFKKRFSGYVGGENDHFVDSVEDLVSKVRQKDEKIAEITKSKEEKISLIASLETDNERLCEELAKLKRADEFKHEIADLKDIILKRNREIESLKSECDSQTETARNLKKEIEISQNEATDLKTQISDMFEEFETARAVQQNIFKSDNDGLKNQISQFRGEIKTLAAEMCALKTETGHTQKALERTTILGEQWEAKSEDAAAQNERLNLEIASKDAEIKALKERTVVAETAENEGIKRENEEIKRENEEIKRENQKLTLEISEKNEEMRRLKRVEAKVGEMRTKVKTMGDERYKVAEECRNLIDAKKAMEKENSGLKADIESLKEAAESSESKVSGEIDGIRKEFEKERDGWEKERGVLERALIEKDEVVKRNNGALKEKTDLIENLVATNFKLEDDTCDLEEKLRTLSEQKESLSAEIRKAAENAEKIEVLAKKSTETAIEKLKSEKETISAELKAAMDQLSSAEKSAESVKNEFLEKTKELNEKLGKREKLLWETSQSKIELKKDVEERIKVLIDEKKCLEKNLKAKDELLISVSDFVAQCSSAENKNEFDNFQFGKTDDQIGIKIFTDFKSIIESQKSQKKLIRENEDKTVKLLYEIDSLTEKTQNLETRIKENETVIRTQKEKVSKISEENDGLRVKLQNSSGEKDKKVIETPIKTQNGEKIDKKILTTVINRVEKITNIVISLSSALDREKISPGTPTSKTHKMSPRSVSEKTLKPPKKPSQTKVTIMRRLSEMIKTAVSRREVEKFTVVDLNEHSSGNFEFCQKTKKWVDKTVSKSQSNSAETTKPNLPPIQKPPAPASPALKRTLGRYLSVGAEIGFQPSEAEPTAKQPPTAPPSPSATWKTFISSALTELEKLSEIVMSCVEGGGEDGCEGGNAAAVEKVARILIAGKAEVETLAVCTKCEVARKDYTAKMDEKEKEIISLKIEAGCFKKEKLIKKPENPSQILSSQLSEILEKQKRCLELSEHASLDLRDVKQIATSSESREMAKYYSAIGKERCGLAASSIGKMSRRSLLLLLLAIFVAIFAMSASSHTRHLWDLVESSNLLFVNFIRDKLGQAST